MRDRDELHIKRSDIQSLTVFHGDQFRAVEQPCFFNAISCETKRDCRAVDRKTQLTQQVLQCTDMVLVAVSGNTTNDAFCIRSQPGEVRENQIDTVHVRLREHEPAIEHQQFVVLLQDHAVTADLTKTTEKINPD